MEKTAARRGFFVSGITVHHWAGSDFGRNFVQLHVVSVIMPAFLVVRTQIVLWLVLHPLFCLYCYLKARKAGSKGWPWGVLGLATGPLALPLLLNHLRLRKRQQLGRRGVWFNP